MEVRADIKHIILGLKISLWTGKGCTELAPQRRQRFVESVPLLVPSGCSISLSQGTRPPFSPFSPLSSASTFLVNHLKLLKRKKRKRKKENFRDK